MYAKIGIFYHTLATFTALVNSEEDKMLNVSAAGR